MPVLTFYKTVFAPYDDPDPATELVNGVASATSEVLIDIYGFTYVPLMDALIAAHARKVTVRIVADHTQAEGTAEHPQLQRLVDAGIDLTIGVSSRGGIDHSKYIVIDQATVIFGSFNFSESALSQDNTVTVTNDLAMVARFVANWQQVYHDAAERHPEWQLTPAPQGSSSSSSSPTPS